MNHISNYLPNQVPKYKKKRLSAPRNGWQFHKAKQRIVFPLPTILKDIHGFLSKKTDLQLKMMDQLIYMHIKHKLVRILQGSIAGNLNCSREYVNQELKKFEAAGFFASTRIYDTCKIYFVSPFIFQLSHSLSRYFPSLKLMSLMLLFSHLDGISKHELTSIFLRSYNYYIFTVNRLGYIKKYKQSESIPMKDILPEIILKLKEYIPRISRWGQIRFVVFPPEIIHDKLQELKESNSITDPVNWLYWACKDECDKRNIPIDYQAYYVLKHQLNEPSQPSMYVRLSDNDSQVSYVVDSVPSSKTPETKIPQRDRSESIAKVFSDSKEEYAMKHSVGFTRLGDKPKPLPIKSI